MRVMTQLSAGAVERWMKLQDVMLRAMAKRITRYQAAEIPGNVVGRCSAGNTKKTDEHGN